MAETVIRVSNLGKKYVIGHQQKGRSRSQSLNTQLEALGITPDLEHPLLSYSDVRVFPVDSR
jgi:hypothetical protein